MSDETYDVDNEGAPLDAPDLGDTPSPPLDESPYEIQPLDVEERSLDRDGGQTRRGD